MRGTKILIALWFGFSSVGLPQHDTFDTFDGLTTSTLAATSEAHNYVNSPEPVPARHILPEDVVQDSIQVVRFSTNSFAVRWTYTEAGAKKMLAFSEAHEGRKVRIVIGSFETSAHEFVFRPMPPVFTNYAQWKDGWLKRRTDKCFVASEDDAKRMVAGLTSK